MISFRRATDADRSFIQSGWSTSYRSSAYAGCIAMEAWADAMHRTIDIVLARTETLAIVAFDQDEGILCGFIVAEPDSHPPLVHYIFVKQPYRRAGIARRLFSSVKIDPGGHFHYACGNPLVLRLERKIPFAKFRPVMARFPRNQRWMWRIES